METKKIFVCATVYQIIVMLQLKRTIYQDCKADLLLLDNIRSYRDLAKKISREKLFEEIYTVDKSCVVFNTVIRDFATNKFYKVIKDNGLKDKLLKNKYSEFIFSSLDPFTSFLAGYFLRRNRRMKITMYEDGASSYSRHYERAFSNIINGKPFIKPLIYRLLHSPLLYVSKFYFFNPAAIVWGAPNVEKIPAIDTNNIEFRLLLNRIFDYEHIKDCYSEKVIFFEESYFADGVDVPDVELVNKLADKYGKDQIFIKKHPRNPTNRFEHLGYKTNIDTMIPWEVIAMNIDLSNKVIATISSTAAISTILMFPNTNVIFFCDDVKTDNFRVNSTVEVIKRIQKSYNI